ncbi:MAG: PEGA domain-containing protein [Deltaproteobacteria bacterium]|nr:PEGA domain-containing protein [Deltaproteobacteria bacterium]MBT6489680.1 PEGA domain-containing protein [Deltaproteobacteria bacterium]
MNKVVWRYLALLSIVTLWSFNASAQTKVLLMPVSGIGEDIPDNAKSGMLDAVRDELKARGEVFIIDGRFSSKARKKVKRGRKRKTDNDLRRAIAKLEDARRQMERLKFDRAIEPLQAVIKQFEKDIDLLDDYQLLVEAHVMLSVAYLRRGKQRQGKKVLEKLLVVRPDLTVDPRDYPPMFLTLLNKTRSKVMARGTGTIRVPGSTQPQEVYLNGRLMGRSPLLIDKVMTGQNHIRIVATGRNYSGHIAKVTKDTTTLIMDSMAIQGESGAETLEDKIKANQFDNGMRKELRTIARKRGADYVVVLALGPGTGLLSCGGYIGNVRNRTWSRLKQVSPDVDMLSVGIEASTLVSSMGEEMKGFTDPIRGEVDFIEGVSTGKSVRRPRQRRERTVMFMSSDEVEAASKASAPPKDRLERDANKDDRVAVRKPRSRSTAVPKRQDLMPSEAVGAGAALGLARLDLDNELAKKDGDSIVDKWWFWTSIAVAVAGAGVGTYFLATHEGTPTDVNVSVTW